MQKKKRTLSLILLSGTVFMFPMANAMAAYPDRPLELTVPYGAGGATDAIARQLATLLENELGQTVVVVNRPGVAGTLQAAHLAKSKPDGYTIGLIGYNSITYTAQLLSKKPYEIDDFTILGGVGQFGYGIAVPTNSPIKNVDDLVKASKEKHGVTYAVTGPPNNIPFVRLAAMTGGRFEEIAYKSGMEAVTAAAGSHVDSVLQNPPDIAPLAQAGAVRLIASATEDRIEGFPDVPTMQEQGYDIVVYSGLGLAAPKGIPEEAREKLEGAINKIMVNPVYIDFMKGHYMKTTPTSGAEFKKLLEEGYVTMGKLIKELNVPMIN